jgi:hypothetical protein
MSSIEHYLLLRDRWVPASEITSTLHVDERDLRARDGKPGLCSNFAISGRQGYKHVKYATEEEWAACDAHLRSHSIAQLERLANLRTCREAHLNNTHSTEAQGHTFDRAGQGQLLS